jgi:hypothetical protein
MNLLFQLRVSPHEGTLLQGQQTVLARDLGGLLGAKTLKFIPIYSLRI